MIRSSAFFGVHKKEVLNMKRIYICLECHEEFDYNYNEKCPSCKSENIKSK